MRPAWQRAIRGFTLLEVLIALAVLAIGMIAVIGTAGTSIREAAVLKQETFANWVAMNELTTLRLAASWPATGTLKGQSKMAGQEWHWRATITTTSDPDLRRADIDVSSAAAPDDVVISLTGFIGKPPPATQSTVPTNMSPP